MKVIGLTGGIGTGKSTAAAYLADCGFSVIDADQVARRVVEPGTPLLKKLAEVFGNAILREDGSLDRRALAALVFTDETKRETLNRLMHGRIIDEIRQETARLLQQGKARGVIIDAPLLFETGLDKDCQETLLITAERQLRIARVCARDGMTPAEVSARIDSQMDESEKCRRADHVIDNSGTQEELKQKLADLLRRWQSSCAQPDGSGQRKNGRSRQNRRSEAGQEERPAYRQEGGRP